MVWSNAISESVCLSVFCLSLCPLAYRKKSFVQISQNFLFTLPVSLNVARCFSDGNAICYVFPAFFMEDVMFSHNRANRPEPQTTHMFHRVRQVAAPGAKSAVSYCILFFSVLVLYSKLSWQLLGHTLICSIVSNHLELSCWERQSLHFQVQAAISISSAS